MVKFTLRRAGAFFVFVGASLVATVGPAAAHHSFALFDKERSVMLEGTVKEFEWTNPHSWIHLQVPGAGKAIEEWLIELPSAGALAREGWNKLFLKPGEKISVRISPLKDGSKGGALQSFAPDEQR